MRWRRYAYRFSYWACLFDALSAPVVIQMALLLRATGREWQHAVIEEFHKEQDRIRVELVGSADGLRYGQLQVLLVAGEAPHIIFQDPNNLLNWARQGFLVDLAPYLKREPRNSPSTTSSISPGYSTRSTTRSGPYRWIYRSEESCITRDAFAEAGQAPPWPGWTWEDLSRVAHRLTKRTNPESLPDRWGMREPEWYFWWQAIWHYGVLWLTIGLIPRPSPGARKRSKMRYGCIATWFEPVSWPCREHPPTIR